jgi:hypothetical protein
MFLFSFDEEIAQGVDVITETRRQIKSDGASFSHDRIILTAHLKGRVPSRERRGLQSRAREA